MIECAHCRKRFKPKVPKQIYCKDACRKLAWETRGGGNYRFVCRSCGVVFSKSRKTSGNGTKGYEFCGQKCANAELGRLRARKKRIIRFGGYAYRYAPNHPRSHTGRVAEHILVMEAEVGRFITEDEPIHHKNLIKDDNRRENLFLCSDLPEHNLIHGRMRRLLPRFLKENGVEKKFQRYMDRHLFSNDEFKRQHEDRAKKGKK